MDTVTLLVVLASLVFTYALQRLFRRRNTPPGPTGLPIVGYLPFLSRTPYLEFQKLAKKYGNVFSLQMGSVPMVILNDFESTKEAFAKDAFIGRPRESPFDQNEETLDTEAFIGLPWKEQRRFSVHMLRDLGFGKTKMEGHIREEINELLERLEENANKPFAMTEHLASSMSNNISSLVFGKRLKYDDPDRKMMTRILNETAAAAGQATWQLFFPKLKKVCKFLGIGGVQRISKLQEEMRDYTMKCINEHERTLNPNDIRDYIDGYLLEIQKRKGDPSFSKPVLQDMVGTFFGAGSETVRLSVEWSTLTAAQYQDHQLRVQKEIDSVIGRNRSPTYQDQKDMPYTQAFIMEVMRWRTIIPLNLIRYAVADGEIGGYFIPKHTQILSNMWAIHHNPDFWGADAEEFNPKRFLTENLKEVKKLDHWIPFSIGKRACPGEPLAKIETFLYFASILQRFNVTVPDGKTLDFEGNLGIGLMPKRQELIFTKRS